MGTSRAFLLAAGAVAAAAVLPLRAARLSALETADLRLVYVESTQSYLVPHVARCFENSLEVHRRLFGYAPSEPITVFLADFSDTGNASATSVPHNLLLLQTSPLSFAYETVTPNERMNWLMNHELVHIAAVDEASPADRTFRKWFGGKVAPNGDDPESIGYSYLTTPRDAAPRWYHEGAAVFVETWMAGGLGRAQGAYDEMVFRSMVRDGSRFYEPLGLVSEGTKVDFQVEANSYLYGTRFLSYLAYQHSPEAVLSWVGRDDGSRAYYADQFRQVFGQKLSVAWREWTAWEAEFQRRNLASIRRFPTTPYRDLSAAPLGSVSRAWLDRETGRMYLAFNAPGIVSHIGAIHLDGGELERIREVKGPLIYTVTSLTWDPVSRTIFYATDNNAWRDLYALDPDTGKTRRLLEDARIGDLVFRAEDRTLWGVRHFNGIATLVEIPPPYDEWRRIHSWPYGEVPYDLDLSPDGRLLSASIGGIDGHHTLRVMDVAKLREGDTTAVAEVAFGPVIPGGFVFSPDGRFLFGSSAYTGVSNIYRLELATDQLEAVSNTDGGLFRPLPLSDDRLIAFRYTGDGFVPAEIDARPVEDVGSIVFLGNEIVERYPQLRQWAAGSPADVPLDDLVLRRGRYRSGSGIGVESVYPIVEGYKDYAAYGARLNLADPLQLNRLSLTASYTPNSGLPSEERLHGQLRYERHAVTLLATYNDADFYDLFGPTQTSRKGYSLGVGHKRALIYDEPRRLDLELGATAYRNIDRLPAYQNVAAPFDDLSEASAGLTYRHVRSSLGAVDHEKGIGASLQVGATYVHEEWIPQALATVDLGIALPLRHSSIWLRGAAGAASGDPEDPFANWYLGGFGNNWVDHGPVKRYREWYAFPGLELNQAGGRNFVRSTLEWTLPPLRFRGAGTPGLHATWARMALFTSGLETNLDDAAVRQRFGDAGLQVDVRFTALSRLDLTLSVGYAVATEESGDTTDEFMLSLKVLN